MVVEGRPVGRVNLSREGTFELPLPPGTTGRVRILAMVGMRGINLAGFSTETLAVPPTPTRGVLGALGSR